MATLQNNCTNGNLYVSNPPGSTWTSVLGTSGTATWTTGITGTGAVGGDFPKIKEWTKIKCHKCGKEMGFVKDSYDWKVDNYYCEDCRLIEKLKE